jgi:hypothetical protein
MTDTFVGDPYDAFKDWLGWNEEEEGWTSSKLLEKYEYLKTVTQRNMPELWTGLEFALSVKTILNIKGCTLPFPGILLGPSSGSKTVIIEIFKGYKHTFYTDSFSPKSFVSHNSSVSEDKLRKIDLLPKIKNKFFLVSELAPIFSARDDDLLLVLGILTRVADGHGYESDSGAQGHRGYDENIMFTFVGAAVDIPPKVHRILGTLGPKLYFYRLPLTEQNEDYYFNTKDEDFEEKKEDIRAALHEYLVYFDMNPEIIIEEVYHDGESFGLPKIPVETCKDDELAYRIIIRLAKLLARLRAIVPTWETRDTQGSEYGFSLPRIENPKRAITQLSNLARGHALSMGRKYISMDDIPMIIETALSTATMERVRIFELLIEHRGVLKTSDIVDSLNCSKPTALRTMTELRAVGLVDITEGLEYRIDLKSKFEWFLSRDFATLKERKEKYPPRGQSEDITRDIDIDIDGLRGGENSLRVHIPIKPLEQWDASDFRSVGCIHCINNGGYIGPAPLTTEEYETHIVMNHKNRPPYPAALDIEKYGLKHPDSKGNE